MKIFDFLINLCVSSETEFSKDQNKLSTSADYHKHYVTEVFYQLCSETTSEASHNLLQLQ